MKKIILTFIICFSAAWPSFAQNNMEAMRFLTINALMQYGEKLYDRGDFDGATSVFNHVLTYDGHQAQALKLLKQMGHEPEVNSNTIIEPKAIQSVNIADTEALKKAIEFKKQTIEKLKDQIAQLKINITSQSKVE